MSLKYANVSLKQKKITSGTHNYATNLGKHLLRDTVEYYQLADKTQSSKNEVLIDMEEDTLAKSLNKFLKKHKLKTRNKTTVQAYQLVFSIPKELKNDPDIVAKFKKEVVNFLNTDPKFKDNVLLCVYHGDELQPHIQAVCSPRCHDNTLNFKRMLGGFNGSLKLHKLHDDFHEHVSSKLGLARGDGTHTSGLDHKRYVKGIAEVAAPIQAVDQVPAAVSSLNPWTRVSELENENLALRKNNAVLSKGISKTLFYESQSNELKKANGKLRKTKKELETKIMKISNEKKENLRQIPCEEVLEALGYEVKAEGTTHRCKTETMNLVINNENMFTENKSMKQGFGAISLLVDVLNYTFPKAVQYLAQTFGTDKTTKVALSNETHVNDLVKKAVKTTAKEIPKAVDKNNFKIIDYLTKTRKIDKEIVNDLISKNLLFADKFNNCVFINKKRNFAYQRGTYQQEGKKAFVSVAGEPDFIIYEFGNTNDTYLFESAIDALSFKTMYPEKEGKFVVLNGSMLINRHHEVTDGAKKVFLCFDNDEQGEKFCAKISAELVCEIEILKPVSKDFNEDLKNGGYTTPTSTGTRYKI